MNTFGKPKPKVKINSLHTIAKIMANSPNPDYIPSIMSDEFGTVVLITNPKSDKYLKSVKTSIMREDDFRKKMAKN